MGRLTIGEAKVLAKDNMVVKNGKCLIDDVTSLKRMTRKDAFEYYNAKLYGIWKTMLIDDIPIKKRDEVLNYLLGRQNA